ncbi:trypsin inhibitor ClTI-1-like [Podarcis muralis]
MKTAGVFVVLSLALCFLSGVDSDSGSEVNCERYLRVPRPGGVTLACPSIFLQICGTDGRTYTSECKICQHNLEADDNVGRMHYGACKRK